MTDRPRIIVNAMPSDYTLVGRVVSLVTAPGYEWPADNITSIAFHAEGQEPWKGRSFGAIRRKTCITIYGPGEAA